MLMPISNSPSSQPTVSIDYGSFNNSGEQYHSNIAHANSPPAYSPTANEDPTTAIASSMASLMNSNGSVSNDNSQYQYSNGFNPSATNYTVTDNSALTSSYYEVPQETYTQTQDVQIVDVSSTGTASFADYTTVQTQTAGYPQDVSFTSEYVSTTTDDVTTSGFEFTDTTEFEYTDSN